MSYYLSNSEPDKDEGEKNKAALKALIRSFHWRDVQNHPASYAVLLTNFVMLFGLIFLHWSGQLIVAAYFLETIIVGLFNALKMILIWRFNPKPDNPDDVGLKGGALVPFFIFHYGFFIFVQMVIFVSFSAAFDSSLKDVDGGFIPNIPQYFIINLGPDFWFIVGNFVLGQIIYLVTVFLYRGEFTTVTLGTQMMKPYARIFVQQITVILSGFFLLVFNTSFVVPLLLITFKTIADIIVVQLELNKIKKASEKPHATGSI